MRGSRRRWRAGRRSSSSLTESRQLVEQARAAAGDRDVAIAGGGTAIQQALAAGLVDELQVHVAPILLGGGTRLFGEGADPVRLEATRVLASPRATHLRFAVGS